MTREVQVQTPGRLHFGLTSFAGQGRQFGGLGLMIDRGGVTLKISQAESFAANGTHATRVVEFAEAFAHFADSDTLPACRIDVLSSPPDHVGLGVGTQLGLAIAAGLSEWLGFDWRNAPTLCKMSGRGQRSAIGTHGFLHGGLLFDAGKLPNEPLGQLADRADLPDDWRIVLIRQPQKFGMAGHAETDAIASLPPVPKAITEQLECLIRDQILPAAREADFAAFSSALYGYGYLAGECFAPVQGGPFASTEIATLVQTIRDLGCAGTGQSSWGPTVFVMAENQQSVEQLVESLRNQPDYRSCQFDVSQANNTGATVCSNELRCVTNTDQAVAVSRRP